MAMLAINDFNGVPILMVKVRETCSPYGGGFPKNIYLLTRKM